MLRKIGEGVNAYDASVPDCQALPHGDLPWPKTDISIHSDHILLQYSYPAVMYMIYHTSQTVAYF